MCVHIYIQKYIEIYIIPASDDIDTLFYFIEFHL